MQSLYSGMTAEDQASNQPAEHTSSLQVNSLADATSLAEIEEQANKLLDYINQLSSLAGNACDTAILHSASAQHIEESHQAEVGDLQARLELTTSSLQAREQDLARLDQALSQRLSSLEADLRDKDALLSNRDNELKHLRAELSCLLGRLEENDQAVKLIEQRADQQLSPLTQEIAALKTEMTQRDESFKARSETWRKTEFELRQKSLADDKRLRELETRLQSQETQLKEKDAVIQATAAKETEIGNLIKRLSTECQNLSLELQEKTRLVDQIDPKKAQAQAAKPAWRRVMGRLQEDAL